MPRYEPEELAWLLFYSTFDLSFAQIAKLYNHRFDPPVHRSDDAIRQRLYQAKIKHHLRNDQGSLDPDKVRAHLEWFMLDNDLVEPRLDGGLPESDREILRGTAIEVILTQAVDKDAA